MHLHMNTISLSYSVSVNTEVSLFTAFEEFIVINHHNSISCIYAHTDCY